MLLEQSRKWSMSRRLVMTIPSGIFQLAPTKAGRCPDLQRTYCPGGVEHHAVLPEADYESLPVHHYEKQFLTKQYVTVDRVTSRQHQITILLTLR